MAKSVASLVGEEEKEEEFYGPGHPGWDPGEVPPPGWEPSAPTPAPVPTPAPSPTPTPPTPGVPSAPIGGGTAALTPGERVTGITEKIKGTKVTSPGSVEEILKLHSERIAYRLEAEQGIPAQETYDRLRGVAGWENAYAARMVKDGKWTTEGAVEWIGHRSGQIGFQQGEAGYENLEAWFNAYQRQYGAPPIVTEPSVDSATWIPDFTQVDPWAGMPLDYAINAVQNYVPVPGQVMPPIPIAKLTELGITIDEALLELTAAENGERMRLNALKAKTEEVEVSSLNEALGQSMVREANKILDALGAGIEEKQEIFAQARKYNSAKEAMIRMFPTFEMLGEEFFQTALTDNLQHYLEMTRITGRTPESVAFLRSLDPTLNPIRKDYESRLNDFFGVQTDIDREKILRSGGVSEDEISKLIAQSKLELGSEEWLEKFKSLNPSLRKDLWYGLSSRSVGTALGGLVESAGGVAAWAKEEKVASTMFKVADVLQSAAPPAEPWKGMESLVDPRFWQVSALQPVTFSAVVLPMAILAAYGGVVSAGAIGFGAFGTAVMGSAYAAGTAGVIEAALEAGSVYNQAKALNMTDDEADHATTITFWKNFAVLTGTNFIEFAAAFLPIPKGTLGSLITRGFAKPIIVGGRVTASGLTEGGQEYVQNIFSRQALGQPIVWDDDAKLAVILGTMMGVGVGGTGAVFTTIQSRVKSKLTPEQNQFFEEKKDDWIQFGLTEDAAELKAMDDLIDNMPEVNEVTKETTEEILREEAGKVIKPKNAAEALAWQHVTKAEPVTQEGKPLVTAGEEGGITLPGGEEVSPEIAPNMALPDMDAQVRTITPPKQGGTEWTVEIGLQESLGEAGGDIVTWTYTSKPTLAEIRADIIKEYQTTKAEINKEAAMGVVAKSGRAELIEGAIDKVLSRVPDLAVQQPTPEVAERVVIRNLKTGEVIIVSPKDIEMRQTPLGSDAWYKGQRVTKPASREDLLKEIQNFEQIAKETGTTPEKLYGVSYSRAKEELIQFEVAPTAPAPGWYTPLIDINSRIASHKYLISDFEKSNSKQLSSTKNNAVKRQYEEYKQELANLELEKERILTQPTPTAPVAGVTPAAIPVTEEVVRDELDALIDALPEERKIYAEGGTPIDMNEPVPQQVLDHIPFAKDLGAEAFVRPSRKVFEQLGQYELGKEIRKAEVLEMEEKAVFLKKLKEVSKWVDKKRRSLVFEELENPGTVKNLTFDEKRAVAWFKTFFDKWADRLNLPADKRIDGYVTHIFEADITEALKAEHPLDPAIARALEYRTPKRIFNPYLQDRLGATTGLIQDPFAAASAYESRELKVFYYEPMLKKIAAIANQKETPPILRAYMKEYARRITGAEFIVDKAANNTLASFANKLSGLPGSDWLVNKLSRGNPSGMAAHQYTSVLYTMWLGFKATSAIRNLSQHTLIIGEVGPGHFANGIKLRFTKEGKEALSKSLVLRSRKAAFLPGIDDSFASRWTDEFRESALYMFRLADLQNVSDAFLAGYSEAKSLLPNADQQTWIDRGDEVAADTQYLYTKMNTMAVAQMGAGGRTLSVLTSWSENWIELMTKWVSRRPSQVYAQHEKVTGEKISGANWSTSYKAILMYITIVGLGYAVKELTRLKAWEYTGITSIKYLADIVGGDFPGLELPGAVGDMISGFLTDDEARMKQGWKATGRTLTPGIANQIDHIAEGEKDIWTLFLYLKDKDFKTAQLKDSWKKGFEPYTELETAKARNFYRKENPGVEAQLFVISQVTTLSSDAAREEVLRLIEKHKLDTEMIDGYEKVFGIDTSEELSKAKKRLGEVKVQTGVGLAVEGVLPVDYVEGEVKYVSMGDFASEVKRLEKVMGRAKLERDGLPLAVEYLKASDQFKAYEAQSPDGRNLYRQQFPDVEAQLYFWGEVSTFKNPRSADIVLALMKKYDIPPQAIKAFADNPAKYDELFTKTFELETKWFDLNTEYENYGNPESPVYIEDKELRKEAREKLQADNVDWMADMRRVDALDLGASEELANKWAERGGIVDELSAGNAKSTVWLVDNPEVHKWAIDNKLLTDNGSDWNVPVLRINADYQEQDDKYKSFGDKESPSYISADKLREETRARMLEQDEEYRQARYRRDAYGATSPTGETFTEQQVNQYVTYYELPTKGFRRERYLLNNPEFAIAWSNIKGDSLPKAGDVPPVQYDDLKEKFQSEFEEYTKIGELPHESTVRAKRNAMIMTNGKFTDFGKAYYTIAGYDNKFKDIANYVGYNEILQRGNPDPKEAWYEDDWYLMEHMDFYREAKKVLGWETKDFRKVPSRQVFSLYQQYNELPTSGTTRLLFRYNHPELEAWMIIPGAVSTEGYKPVGDRWLTPIKITEGDIPTSDNRPKSEPTPEPTRTKQGQPMPESLRQQIAELESRLAGVK